MKPYVDLHLHLDGSISIQNAKQLASLQHISIPDNDDEIRQLLEVSKDCHNLNEFLEKFAFPCSLLQSYEALKLATKNLLNELKQDGLVYAEIRFAPQKHTEQMSQKEAIEAVLEGMKESFLPCGLILCCMRSDDNEKENFETVELAKEFLNKGVVALDLAGAEALYKTKTFENVFSKARGYSIPFTIHAGEADGPESIWDALSFGACRIGHGVRAVEDPELVKELAKRKIPLELCLTSNIQTCIYDTYEQFPLRELMDAGVVVTINTDDMAVCGTTLKREYEKLRNHLHLTESEEEMLIKNGIESSFAN